MPSRRSTRRPLHARREEGQHIGGVPRQRGPGRSPRRWGDTWAPPQPVATDRELSASCGRSARGAPAPGHFGPSPELERAPSGARLRVEPSGSRPRRPSSRPWRCFQAQQSPRASIRRCRRTREATRPGNRSSPAALVVVMVLHVEDHAAVLDVDRVPLAGRCRSGCNRRDHRLDRGRGPHLPGPGSRPEQCSK